MKNFSAGKRTNGMRVIQIRLKEEAFDNLKFLAKRVQVEPQQLIEYLVQRAYAAFCAESESQVEGAKQRMVAEAAEVSALQRQAEAMIAGKVPAAEEKAEG